MPKPTTFARRQRILELLDARPGIRVPEMASLLHVSEGTVRNDLNALAGAGQLERVRGGGVPRDDNPGLSAAFAARLRVQRIAKQHIARWAADLVDDGDTIVLDASTTVYHMAPFLEDRRNLTIITNGVEVGRRLARNTSHTVILLGGMLNADGIPVGDLVSEQFLRDAHIKLTFVSCAGFQPEAGLTERDFLDAQLKSQMVAAGRAVIALVDSTKFGRAFIVPFARTDQITHFLSDGELSSEWIAELQRARSTLTLCGADSARTLTPAADEKKHYRIGFANLGENMPFSIDVRHGIERAAQADGHIDLVLADNQLNGEVAVEVADRLIAQGLDLVIEYQIDEQAGHRLMDKFRQANIPVIAIDIPLVGATFFGVDNYRAGHMAGVALGNWLLTNWKGEVDRLFILTEPRAGAFPAARIQGQLDGLESIVGPIAAERRTTLNSGNTSEISAAAMEAALDESPDARRIAVLCFNDDAAMGASNAACRLGRQGDVVIVGQGADRRVRQALHDPNARIIGSTAYFPERYGEQVIALALKILRGEPAPPAVYMEHTFVPADGR